MNTERSQGSAILKAVGLCLLVAGTLDICDALIFYGLRGVPAERLLQNIASGLLGGAAFHGGFATALLGLAIHYTITFCWALAFVIAAMRVRFLARYATLSGLMYGAIIYFVMNFVVLPLTRVASHNHRPVPIVIVNAVLALLFCQGLPIALIARHFFGE